MTKPAVIAKPVVIAKLRYSVITLFRYNAISPAKLRKNSFAAKPFRFISPLRTLRKPVFDLFHQILCLLASCFI